MHPLRIPIALIALLLAVPSWAALSPEEACRGRVAKEGRKFFGGVYKARQQCLDNVAKGTLPGGTDCSVEPKAVLKVTKAGVKLEQNIRSQCTDGHVLAAGFSGDCVAATTVDDLVTCVRDSHTAAAVSILDDLQGPTLVGNTGAQKCRKTAETQLRKVADKRLKEAWKCRDSVDKGKLPGSTNCVVAAEENEKIAKFEAKVRQKVDAACGNGASAPIADAEFPAPCSADISGNFYSCERCRLAGTTNELMRAEGLHEDSLVGLEPAVGACIPRTTAAVVLDEELTFNDFGASWEIDFYRNPAYACGLSGNYTFMVIDPTNNPGAEAPLWVFLHGGGTGYYDDQQTYQSIISQDEDTWNHEETFADLQNTILQRILDGGQLEDQTIVRRMQEGYRLLVVAMCDHDQYSGIGTPYPNNPVGGQVNGLQATMAAVDYVAANFPTTQVFGHGTSAGSVGVYSVAVGFALEGAPMTGIVADSAINTPRRDALQTGLGGLPGYPFPASFTLEGVTEKIGVLADLSYPLYPEAMIAAGFTDTPTLFIGGSVDPFCGGNQPPIPEAAAEGFASTCDWAGDGLRQVIDAQPGSPHEAHMFPTEGHVPTLDPSPANDVVDDFIDKVMATSPPPFGSPSGAFVDGVAAGLF